MITSKTKVEERIRLGKAQPSNPKKLKLKDIEIISSLFQHRSKNEAPSRRHVAELIRALKSSQGEPLDSLTVYWVGDAWALLDGHHRYNAYKEHEYSKAVPVNVFNGSFEEAITVGLQDNIKDKLPMGSSEKSNAAWRLVVGTNLSISKIKAASTRSKQTIIDMRKIKNALLEKHPEQYLITIGWDKARRLYQDGRIPKTEHDDEWEDKQAQEVANKLVRHLGNGLGSQPVILWKALEIYDSRITDWFLEYHGIDPETLEKVTAEMIDF